MKKKHECVQIYEDIIKLVRIMKLTVLFIVVMFMQSFANSYGQATEFSFTMEDATIKEVIDHLEQESEYYFFLKQNKEILNKKVDVDFKNSSVEHVLDELLKDTNLSYKIVDRYIAIMPVYEIDFTPEQEKKKIKGKVTDEKGESLPGVSVVVKGTTIGVITNIDGNYSLKIPDNAQSLVFSFIGMESQEILIANQSQISIVLLEATSALEEVVVIGYGVQKKVNLTGAVEVIQAERIEKSLGANTSQALQGLIPNMNVTFNNGGINEKANISIRGDGSINGGSPLVLIDGIEGDMNMISPKDIESLTVLKDAASASIYGARAAFGVILITTKQAQTGKVRINYNAVFGWSSPTIRTDNFITDGLEWARLSDKLSLLENTSTYLGYGEEDYAYMEARKKDPSLPSVLIKTIDGVERYVHYANTDWWDYVFADIQPSQEHNISLSGGSDKVKFYLSGRYYNRKGIYKINPDVLNSYSVRSKISVQATEKLKIENSTNIFISNYTEPATNTRRLGGASNHEDWRKYTFHAAPVFNPRNPDGSILINGAYTPTRAIADGTFADLTYGKSKGERDECDVTNTTSLTLDLMEGISVHGDYSFRKGSPKSWVRLIATPHTNQPNGEGVSLYKNNKQTYKEISWDRLYQAVNAYVNYSIKLFEKHELSGVLGYNQEWRTWKRVVARRNGNLSENLNSFNLATGEDIQLKSDANEWAIRAAFYRLKYNISDKYLFEFNGRFDLSSKFPKEDRLGIFPSASVAWRVSEENFFEGSRKYIDNLKLRASYGTLGNQNVGEYDYVSNMSVSRGSYISDGSALNYLTTPNPISSNFTWEKSATLDFGIDVSAFNNSLNISYDWYERNITDMLTQGKQLPSVFGAAEPDENAADLRTRGFELSVKWNDKLNIAGKPFKYNVGLILANYTSEITKFDNPNGDIEQYYVGQKFGEVWGYTVDGFFQTDQEYLSHADQLLVNRRIHENYLINHPVAGDIKFRDVNKDGKISAGNRTLNNPGDLKVIGNTTPKYSYGINLGFDYSGFDFSTFLQGVVSQDWWPGKDNGYFFGPFSRQYQNFIPKSIESNSWTPDNPNAYFPRLAVYSTINQGLEGSQLGVPSDKYLQDVGYLRVKNITLGYTLPKHWIEKLKLDKVRFYVSGSNLFTFSKLYKNNPDRTVDPEQLGNGNAYPFSKTVAFGIDVKF